MDDQNKLFSEAIEVARAVEIVRKLNEILSEFLFDKYGDDEYPIFELKTNGSIIIITFLDFRIWFSNEDEREFNEGKNEYEPLEEYLRKEAQKLITRISSLKEIF